MAPGYHRTMIVLHKFALKVLLAQWIFIALIIHETRPGNEYMYPIHRSGGSPPTNLYLE